MDFVPLPARRTPHTIRVRAYTGHAGAGALYAASRDVAAFAEDTQKLVTDTNGTEVVSTSQVTVNFGEQIPVGSLVTVWPGLTGEREAKVVAVSRHHHPTLPSYQTLSLT